MGDKNGEKPVHKKRKYTDTVFSESRLALYACWLLPGIMLRNSNVGAASFVSGVESGDFSKSECRWPGRPLDRDRRPSALARYDDRTAVATLRGTYQLRDL